MIRKIIIGLFRFALRVFFRHIESVGTERVPRDKPVIFVLNHPNALIDPAFVLCLAPRHASFLAKAPIFKMPVIGFMARALDALPVYRREDKGSDMSRNDASLHAAEDKLATGGAIAICPEGVSHNDPELKPLKAGTARIALTAAARGVDVCIQPVGLYYTAKAAFRSSVLLYYNEPFHVQAVEMDADGDPPRAAVDALNAKIEQEMRAVMFEAQSLEAENIVTRAERIFSSDEESAGEKITLAEELRRKQRFVTAYSHLKESAPERIENLLIRIRRYEEELQQIGLQPEEIAAPKSRRSVTARLINRVVFFSLLVAPATIGLILHYPAYLLIKLLAIRLSDNSEDMVATIKLFGSLLIFPLTWIVVFVALNWFLAWHWALLLTLGVPFMGWAAVRFHEKLDEFFGSARAVVYFITNRWFFKRLLVERRAIREEILSLADFTQPGEISPNAGD